MFISTFKDDLIGLEEFATRLEKFIYTEHNFVDGSLVLALNSKYGSGKTTFLRMWMASFRNKTSDDPSPFVISLNAWQSDYYGDPLFAIISSLVESIKKEGQSPKKLINAAKNYAWYATAFSAQLVNKFTGVDPIAASEFVEGKKSKRKESNIIPNTFTVYEERKQAMGALKSAIKEIISSSKPKVLFLVDELDRCRPDYAISYLETIKHIFDIKGAVFILATDRHQLENSAKTAFGPDLDFDEYYRKFVHREVTLPLMSDSGYEKFAAEYVNYYLVNGDTRCCHLGLNRYRIDEITLLIKGFKLTPRQIQEVFRILGHIFETTNENKGRLFWCLGLGTIVMVTCKIGRPDIYQSLATGNLEPIAAVELIANRITKTTIEWWFQLLFTGGGIKQEENESLTDLMKKAGFSDVVTNQKYEHDLFQFNQGWGYRGEPNKFTIIHKKIQELAQWS
jgi:hypothetical protein